LLIEHGANIDHAYDYNDDCALHFAAENGHDEVVKYLVNDLKQDINMLNGTGSTPLIQAASKGKGSTITLLMSLGADLKIKNTHGRTAYQCAPSADIKELLTTVNYTSAVNYGNKH